MKGISINDGKMDNSRAQQPRLKKNLLSILALDAKGMRVAFVDGQVLMWSRGKSIDDVIVIGEQEG